MWSIHTMEYFLKKQGNPVTYYSIDEPWGNYAKWIKPVTKQQILWLFHFHEESKVVKFIETESRIVVTRGWGEGEKGSCLTGKEFHFYKMKKLWWSVSQQCEYT